MSRNTRSISQETLTIIRGFNGVVIKIQQPIIHENLSQLSPSIQNQNRRQLSIHDKIKMLSESIRTSDKNERLFQENMILRQKFHQTEDSLQDANIKCSLWEKFKLTLEGLNKDYLQLKSIQNRCSDGTILKEFLSVLKEKLQKLSIIQKLEKSSSVERKRKDTEYYQLYEQQKKQRYDNEQRIITLNNQLDILEKENDKLKQKLKISSLRSSEIINEKEKVKQIVQSLDQHETQLKKKVKQMQNQSLKDKQNIKTLKKQLQQKISENDELKFQVEKLLQKLNDSEVKMTQNNFTIKENQNEDIQESKRYHDLSKKYEHLQAQYDKVKAENEFISLQKDKITQQLIELDDLSKQMEYSYEVKIDNLKKLHENELQNIINNYKSEISSINQNHNNQLKTIENESLLQKKSIKQLQKQVQDIQHAKGQVEEKFQKDLHRYELEISSYTLLIQQKQQFIESLESKNFTLSQRIKSINEKEREFAQKQFIYKQKICAIESQFIRLKQRQGQLEEKVQQLEVLIQSPNQQLEYEKKMVEKYKAELTHKNQLFEQLHKKQVQIIENENIQVKSDQNFKIAHYEHQLNNQKLKNQQLKNKIIQQKEKFTIIMNKNQALYRQLLQKTSTNEKILKETIEIQKIETQKLQNLINKYYSNLLTSEEIPSQNINI